MFSGCTGIILAGGKSSRMGINKSLLKIGETTIIERTVQLLKPLFPNIILITNEQSEYSFLGLPVHEDIYKNSGPLAGIHSGLVHSATEKNFVISCDIPLMTKDVIEFIVNYPSSKPVVIPHADKFEQQLCGVYCKEVIETAELLLTESYSIDEKKSQKRSGYKVRELLSRAGADVIDLENEFSGYIPGTFYNMNNPAEYEYILSKLAQNRAK